MTEEQKPVDVQLDNPPEVVQKEEENVLPDTLPDVNADKVKELENKRIETENKLKEVEKQRDEYSIRLKENQAYISRTRNVDKVAEQPKPQRTLDDYKSEVKKIFEDDPAKGIDKIITDLAYDRDLERQENERRVVQAEERAFKKMLAINPESNKVLKEIEKLDEECPDMQGLSFERKVEFINLRKSGVTKQETDVREKANREAGLAGGVGGSNIRGGGQKIPSWVNDPEVVAGAQGKFSTKQDLLDHADSKKAREMYERKLVAQRAG